MHPAKDRRLSATRWQVTGHVGRRGKSGRYSLPLNFPKAAWTKTQAPLAWRDTERGKVADAIKSSTGLCKVGMFSGINCLDKQPRTLLKYIYLNHSQANSVLMNRTLMPLLITLTACAHPLSPQCFKHVRDILLATLYIFPTCLNPLQFLPSPLECFTIIVFQC